MRKGDTDLSGERVSQESVVGALGFFVQIQTKVSGLQKEHSAEN